MLLNHEMLCGLKLGKATSLELPTSCIMLVDNSLAAHPCGPLTPTYKHTHTLPWCIVLFFIFIIPLMSLYAWLVITHSLPILAQN